MTRETATEPIVDETMPNLTVAAMARKTLRLRNQDSSASVLFGYQIDGVWNRPLTINEAGLAVALLRQTAATIEAQYLLEPQADKQVKMGQISEIVEARDAIRQARIARQVLDQALTNREQALRALVDKLGPAKASSAVGLKINQLPKLHQGVKRGN
jgi:hypothetical protein